MSLTNQQVIDKALGELEIVEAGDSADATDSADAMTVLNQMMAAWGVSDMDFNFFPQDTLSDTCPIPEWSEEGVISNLAVKLSVPFNAVVSQMLFEKAREGRNLIGRTFINLNLEGSDMTHLGATRNRYNLTTDTFWI